MEFTDQLSLEALMAKTGRQRAEDLMDENVNRGRVEANPYSSIIYRRFVEPLAKMIAEEKVNTGPGRRQAYMVFLKGVSPEAVAYIAVRMAFNLLMRSESCSDRMTTVAGQIGRAIQGELLIEQLKDVSPKDWFYLSQDLDERKSSDLDHRYRLVRLRLLKKGTNPIDWGQTGRVQVGAFILEKLASLGLVDIGSIYKGGKTYSIVELSAEILDMVGEVMEMAFESMPYFLPCVEKPVDWSDVFTGGYHTDAMRRLAGPAVMNGNPSDSDVSTILSCINALQSTKWKVNVRILETAKAIQKFMSTKELVSFEFSDKPPKPDFLIHKSKEDMTESEKQAFGQWKRDVAAWHTSKKKNRQAFVRMSNAFEVAELFKEERELFFVYSADFRGRVYPHTVGLNPQGSDIQKALVHFSEGKPIRTKEAKRWFYIHGAGKFGNDKITLDERVKWVEDNKDLFISFADDPENNLGWLEADKQFQFLAWCFELADLERYGAAFVSHLPVAMDGTCNGLQQYSALMLDEVGGKATNLTVTAKPQDVYGQVAVVTTSKLERMPPSIWRDKWLKHGVSRKVVKRSVMTLPYGSTRFSCADFIAKDYLEDVKPKEFKEDEYMKASTFLSHVVWEAIAEVVIKGREAMDWLQRSAELIIQSGHEDIRWVTPSGFIVVQNYRKFLKAKQVVVSIFGTKRSFMVASQGKAPCPKRHRNGVAPNFIHSMDACHMQFVALEGKKKGMSLAMVHDDFGTHAADADEFSQIIRQQFVRLYSDGDWIQNFYQFYKDAGIDLDPPPSKGSLDLSQVLQSPYFFS